MEERGRDPVVSGNLRDSFVSNDETEGSFKPDPVSSPLNLVSVFSRSRSLGLGFFSGGEFNFAVENNLFRLRGDKG
jgi:hypothetical protein